MNLKKHLHYVAEAKWDHKTGGTAKLDGFTQLFDTPRKHDGNETAPCPDQLFTASLAGCIINTFNYYRRILEAETRDLTVNASMDIELTDTDGYRVKGINIDIQVWSDQENKDLNQRIAERAEKYCHITKSIKPAIPINTQITIHTE
jgi:uncharacterized OsmC-like protein